MRRLQDHLLTCKQSRCLSSDCVQFTKLNSFVFNGMVKHLHCETLFGCLAMLIFVFQVQTIRLSSTVQQTIRIFNEFTCKNECKGKKRIWCKKLWNYQDEFTLWKELYFIIAWNIHLFNRLNINSVLGSFYCLASNRLMFFLFWKI